jgi:hypothetical protein
MRVDERVRFERQALSDHDGYMARGCLICHSAVLNRTCPDCYTCLACGLGCDECADLRPSLKPKPKPTLHLKRKSK